MICTIEIVSSIDLSQRVEPIVSRSIVCQSDTSLDENDRHSSLLLCICNYNNNKERSSSRMQAGRHEVDGWMDESKDGWGWGWGWDGQGEHTSSEAQSLRVAAALSLPRSHAPAKASLARSLPSFLQLVAWLFPSSKQATTPRSITNHQSPITNHQSPITNHQAFSSKHTSHTRNTNNTSNTLPHAKLVSRIYGCPISISTQRGSPRWCTEWINRRDSVPS